MSTAQRVVRCSSARFVLPRELWWPYPDPERRLAQDSITLITFEVETDDGLTGSGYVQHFGRSGSAIQATLDHDLAPQLIGADVAHPHVVFDRLYAVVRRLGGGAIATKALSAADITVWDASAKAVGLPLFRHLGAYRESVPVYGSALDRSYSDEDFAATAKENVALGMKAVKVRVALSIAEDERRLGLLRDIVGPHFRVMVDANSNWDLPEALRRLHHLEPFNIDWLEEPVDPTDIAGFAEVQRHTEIPIAGGENIFSVADFNRFLQAGALRVLQPDIDRIGGVTGWLRVAALAHVHNLPICAHLVQDVSVHVLCAAPNGSMLEYLPLFDPIVERPLVVSADGTTRPGDRPGTGVVFRRELIEPHRVA